MVKYLSVPDFHFDIKYLDVCKSNAAAVRKAAVDNNVDFIALPGDLFNRPIYATDEGGINELIRIVESWLSVCPVVAIEGTPSHDAPGSYGPLEKVGLTLLKPGEVSFISGSEGITKAVLFGIPELRKDNIQASLGLPAEQANAEAVKLLKGYIDEYVAPMRSKYDDIPAVGLLHGVVSDYHREDNPDIVIRSSDIVIPTEYLEPAGLDYWNLGHIHKPWSSTVIRASYAGSWGKDWNETGFLPAFELISINDAGAKFDRIPYGTPRREKTTRAADATDPAVAYQLKTDDPDATLPDTVHPWSEVKYVPERKTSSRAESIEKSASLWDLFKIIDPDVPADYRGKVEKTEISTPAALGGAVDVRLRSVEVRGCVLFGGRTATIDVESLNDGLTAIIGENGHGKSSLLSFSTPYPVVVGKDTKSGRASAIKDFFSGQDSLIRKSFDVSGHDHEHLITIKGAHTQNPKTECYLTIDGVPQLEKATFDTMMEKCEELYGPFSDYLLTTFYVQPLQGKTASGLMSASMTDVRNLVQNIAGINREDEKRYALDRASECDSEVARLTSRITTLEEQVSHEDIDAKIAERTASLEEERAEIARLKTEGETARTVVDKVRTEANDAQILIERLKTTERAHADASLRSRALGTDKSRVQGSAAALEANRARAAKYDELTARIESIREEKRKVDDRNTAAQNAHYEARQGFITRQSEIAEAKSERDRIESEIKYHSKSCPACGYVDPEVGDKIKELSAKLDAIVVPEPIAKPEPYTAEAFDETDLNSLTKERDGINIGFVRTAIEAGIRAESELVKIEDEIKTNTADIERLSAEVGRIESEIDYTAGERLKEAERALESLRSQYADKREYVARLESQIEALSSEKEANEIRKREIIAAGEALTGTTADAGAWKYIARMLNPDKIPALELSMVLDAIDADATRNIEPYYDGRFSFRTDTQGMGKTGVVDRFDIMVHDADTGEERSFLAHSPGQKAFFNDAYVKALIRQRNAKGDRSYSPIISDEADGPVSPSLVPAFYDMQAKYYDGKGVKVLVVSHAPGAHQFIQNHVEIEEVLS